MVTRNEKKKETVKTSYSETILRKLVQVSGQTYCTLCIIIMLCVSALLQWIMIECLFRG